jgi:hypothetical protein
MAITIGSVAFLAGLAMVIVAVVGGGVEIKDLKIPTLPLASRVASFALGCVLIILALTPGVTDRVNPSLGIAPTAVAPATAPPSTPQATGLGNPQERTEKKPKQLGAAITNGVITVRDVKMVPNHEGYYKGSID